MLQQRVKLTWHNMAFLGPESIWAAEAAECANDQGKFWPYHDKLFAEQRGENRGAFAKTNLKRFAAELGLDQTRFNACLESDRHLGAIQQEVSAGQQQGVNSTPTLFVNGVKLDGVPSFAQLRETVERLAPLGTPAR